MRYPPGHKQQSRERILNAAADLFRRQGIAATGVDAVMAAAGLTAGGFYSHFRSKHALIAAAVATAGQRAEERWLAPIAGLSGRAFSRAFLARYLSEEHRDDRVTGCSLPSLSAEVARSGAPARKHVERRLRGFFELVAARASEDQKVEEERAIAAVALAVGGVLLARVVVDPVLSRRILKACRTSAEQLLGGAAEPNPKRKS